MADNHRWFKVWTTSLTDEKLSSLPNEMFAIWVKLGSFIKTHGNEGSIEIKSPAKILCALCQCNDVKELINAIKCFPNVQINNKQLVTNVSSVTGNVTYSVTYQNWHKYQIDASSERVKKFREKKRKSETPKRRGEEKRGEENKEEDKEENFITSLKSNSAYKEINIDRELSKMDAWLLTPKGKGRKKTKTFILNWLNKIDISIPTTPKREGRLSDAYKSL